MIRKLFRYLRRLFRDRRYRTIQQLMQLHLVSGFILDLGGGPASFFAERYPDPKSVILVEINPQAARRAKSKIEGISVVIADAEQLPFADKSIALTVCNSVIEHVANPDKLARETQRVSSNYFLQTPNGSFPLETHSLIGIPFYNIIPGKRSRQLVCKIFGASYTLIESVRYISEVELRQLFPSATVIHERFFFLTKSFYVVGKSKMPHRWQ